MGQRGSKGLVDSPQMELLHKANEWREQLCSISKIEPADSDRAMNGVTFWVISESENVWRDLELKKAAYKADRALLATIIVHSATRGWGQIHSNLLVDGNYILRIVGLSSM